MKPEPQSIVPKRKPSMKRLLRASALFNGLLLPGIASVLWVERDSDPPAADGVADGVVAKTPVAAVEETIVVETALPDVSPSLERESAGDLGIPPVPPPTEVDAAASRTLAMDLIAQGWAPEQARAFVIGVLFRQSLEERLDHENEREYWEPISRKERRELRQSHWRRVSAISELLGLQGPGLLDVENNPLPIDKLQAVARIRDDYAQVQLQFAPTEEGIFLPEDLEMRKRIAEEFQRDLEAVLTPEELVEYRLRHSEAAEQLRSELALVDANEAEFRALFELQRARREANPPVGKSSAEAPEAWARYREATEKLDAEMRKQLGEEALQQVERNRNWEYQRLLRLAHRLEIPLEDANRAHDRLQRGIEQQRELLVNRDLSAEDRQEALREIGRELRGELSEILGEEALELYPRHGGGWLNSFPE